MCYVISDKDPVSLPTRFRSGCTGASPLQRVVGMYQGYEHNILMTVVRPRETYRSMSLKES